MRYSTTWVYPMVRREVFSIKIKSKLKRDFKRVIEEKGFSTCFIMETLMSAWLEGFKAEKTAVVDSSRTLVINQKIDYVVKRPRRQKEGGETDGSNLTNFYDSKTTLWSYHAGDLNIHGHAAGCACMVCRVHILHR